MRPLRQAVRVLRRSKAPVRAVPVAEGMAPPKARRAWMAGFGGRAGEAALLHGAHRRTLLVGVGPDDDLLAWQRAGTLAASRLLHETHVALDARGASPEQAAAFAAGAVLGAWRWDRRSAPDPAASVLERFDLLATDPHPVRAAWREVSPGLQAMLLACDLVAEPSDTLTPQGFVQRLGPLHKAGISVQVMEGEALAVAGLHALLAVGRASVHPPLLCVLGWPGAGGGAPVALVGKGITFDTGGISIKPAAGMWEMRADMGGAAACAGALLAHALRGSPVPAMAVLALAENAIGGDAYRPGDVLQTAAGLTVEVVDTDAEGRLVLADALGWTVARYRPRAIVDVATLTGSIVVALGGKMAGAFGDAGLCAALAGAGCAVGEPAWPMPIGDRHRNDLRSAIADLRHCVPGRLQPDACQAAAFLERFVGDVPWAHLDIAGCELALDPEQPHAARPTGFGARLLDRLLVERFGA